jgi:hypothetical protein
VVYLFHFSLCDVCFFLLPGVLYVLSTFPTDKHYYTLFAEYFKTFKSILIIHKIVCFDRAAQSFLIIRLFCLGAYCLFSVHYVLLLCLLRT